MPHDPAEALDPDNDGEESETELCNQHHTGTPEAEEVLGEAGGDGECKGDGDQQLEGADVGAVGTPESCDDDDQGGNPKTCFDHLLGVMPAATACEKLFGTGDLEHIAEC